MTASRRPPRGANRTAKPDSLRAAHEQITRNSGTLADIADLIEMEGKTRAAPRQPAQSSRAQASSEKVSGTSGAMTLEERRRGQFLWQPVLGVPLLIVLICALILGTALGVPLGVATYGSALYTAVVDGLTIF